MTFQATIDAELEAVVAAYKKLDPDGSRTAQVIRNTFDQLYNGQLTGRFCWEQLHKTEKTHCGTLIEINLHREFNFEDGSEMDYKIAGVEVDCKYSQTINAWMIPPEARGHLCLVVSALDNVSPTWSMGLVRVTTERLNAGGNRDAKSTLNDAGRKAISWLFKNSPLPPNVLLQIERDVIKRIMAHKSGQAAIKDLFRFAQCKIVGRAAVATVAKQADYMKRVRANGGARTALKPEGILILGQFKSHAAIARSLDIPVPGQGDTISVRIARASQPGDGVAKIGNHFWRVASPNDPVITAPDLPKT